VTPFERILRRLAGHPDEAALLDFAEAAAGADVPRIAAHIASCPRCAASVAAMREMRPALRALGEVEPPRSFRLAPSMVQRPRPAQARRAYPLAALAGAVAAVVFAALVGYDVTTSGGGERGAPEAELQSARTFAEATPQMAAPAAGAAEAEPTGSPAATDMAGAPPQTEAPAPQAPAAGSEEGGRLALRVAEGIAGAVALSLLVWLALAYRRRSGAR
jgi:hypothetical protein